MLHTFRLSNLLLLKWWLFRFDAKSVVYWGCFYNHLVKNFMMKLHFLIQMSKIHITMYYFIHFDYLKFSVTKMVVI